MRKSKEEKSSVEVTPPEVKKEEIGKVKAGVDKRKAERRGRKKSDITKLRKEVKAKLDRLNFEMEYNEKASKLLQKFVPPELFLFPLNESFKRFDREPLNPVESERLTDAVYAFGIDLVDTFIKHAKWITLGIALMTIIVPRISC
jgi:hypothetical protein